MSLSTALSYLTILRLPGHRQFALAKAVGWFPLVGLFLGAFLALVWEGTYRIAPPPIAALVTLLAWIWITGAMHLDGLANTSEALLSWRSRDSMHQILSSPYVGPLGILAIGFVLAAKGVALVNLERDRAAMALLCAPLFGRSAQLLATCLSGYAKSEGVAVTAFQGGRKKAWRLLFAAALMPLCLQLGWESGVLLMLGGILLVLILVRRIRRLLGGMTGATLGALTEILEAWVLVASTFTVTKLPW